MILRTLGLNLSGMGEVVGEGREGGGGRGGGCHLNSNNPILKGGEQNTNLQRTDKRRVIFRDLHICISATFHASFSNIVPYHAPNNLFLLCSMFEMFLTFSLSAFFPVTTASVPLRQKERFSVIRRSEKRELSLLFGS